VGSERRRPPHVRPWLAPRGRRSVLIGLASTLALAACGKAGPAPPSRLPTSVPPSARSAAPLDGPALRPLAGYGFQADLFTPLRDIALERAREAGFDWIKQRVRWSALEPAGRGRFTWDALDAVVAAVADAKLRLLLNVEHTPAWVLGDRAIGPPGDPLDLKDFLAALANRYRGRVHAYELWNSANLSTAWGYGLLDAGDYVELLLAGYAGVKSGDPNAVVVGGALAPAGDIDLPAQQLQAIDDVAYVQQVYAYQDGIVRRAFDAWGVHAGGFNKAPAQAIGTPRGAGWNGHPSFYFRRLAQHRDVMEQHGDAAKPMWLTEVGWTTASGDPNYSFGADNSEEDQAQFVVDAFRVARAEYPFVTHLFVRSLNAQMVMAPNEAAYGFGVLWADGTPRPAYAALQAMDKGR